MEVRILSAPEFCYREFEVIEQACLVSDKTCFRSSQEDIRKCINSDCSVSVMQSGEIAAYSLCYHTEYGTAYIEKCLVLPAFRGQGLQRKMLAYNIDLLHGRGVVDIYTMAAPTNEPSVKNFEAVGFRVIRKTIYRGQVRLILKYETKD